MKFKVNDKVKLAEGGNWASGAEYKTISSVLEEGYHLNSSGAIWFDDELKLYEDKTEFTAIEALSIINKGETYICTDKEYNLQQITKLDNDNIRLYFQRYYKEFNSNFQNMTINTTAKFRLQESKKKVKIYKIEHTKNGKKYDFVKRDPFDNSIVYPGTLVQCDTKYGTSYGRCVGIEDMELTEAEIKEYKECWRAE